MFLFFRAVSQPLLVLYPSLFGFLHYYFSMCLYYAYSIFFLNTKYQNTISPPNNIEEYLILYINDTYTDGNKKKKYTKVSPLF